MRPAHVVEIVTPKKFSLNGLWFGPSFSMASKGKSKKPKRAIVWLHGLGSSAFSKLDIAEGIADSQTAVLMLNNRGHDNIARLSRAGGKKAVVSGAAFERFEDCLDDVQGAINLAKRNGAKEIFIAGHSTGCQKAAYWAYKNGRGVKGIILLAPMSDYAAAVQKYGLPKLQYFVATAKAMLKSRRGAELLQLKGWTNEPDSPARFISLYTPDSVEQSIFSYFDPTRRAKMLSTIRLPIFAILAEKDEYGDRPAAQILSWFEDHTRAPLRTLIVKGVKHQFRGAEKPVSNAIKSWIRQVI